MDVFEKQVFEAEIFFVPGGASCWTPTFGFKLNDITTKTNHYSIENTVCLSYIFRRGDIISLRDFEASCSGWMSWGFGMFVTKPLSWTFSKLIGSSSSGPEGEFIIPAVLKVSSSLQDPFRIPVSGIIFCMHPANERWRYTWQCTRVALSLICWAHAQNDPWVYHDRSVVVTCVTLSPEIERKYFPKTTCHTDNFICPRPVGSGNVEPCSHSWMSSSAPSACSVQMILPKILEIW